MIGFSCRSQDPSRIYNGESGWSNFEPFQGGSIVDIHDYRVEGPAVVMDTPISGMPNVVNNGNDASTGDSLVAVCGEFGGIGKRTPNHEWDPQGSFAIQDPAKQPTVEAWFNVYNGQVKKIASDIGKGQSASILTQLSDVEQEVNLHGLQACSVS